MGGTSDKADPALYAVSQRQLAWIFGKSMQWVRLSLGNGAPSKEESGYSVRAWVEWYLRRRGHGHDDEKKADSYARAMRDAQLAEQKAKAKERELKASQLEGSVVSRVEYEKALNDRSAWFVQVLDVLPGKAAPLVAGKSVAAAKRVLRDICRIAQKAAYGQHR